MKKLLVLALSLMTGLIAFAGPQGDDNGLGIKLFAGFHNSEYGLPTYDLGILSSAVEVDAPNPSPCLGIALDNRWYVANPGNAGIAINARWIDYSIAFLKEDGCKTRYSDFSLLGVGAIGTYYLSDEMAIDAFYNICPNILIEKTKFDDGDGDLDEVGYYLGASHRLGAAYRYKVFQAGFEMKLGTLTGQDWGDNDDEYGGLFTVYDAKTNNFRIFLGFKF